MNIDPPISYAARFIVENYRSLPRISIVRKIWNHEEDDYNALVMRFDSGLVVKFRFEEDLQILQDTVELQHTYLETKKAFEIAAKGWIPEWEPEMEDLNTI